VEEDGTESQNGKKGVKSLAKGLKDLEIIKKRVDSIAE
jgi:hypothetical protein